MARTKTQTKEEMTARLAYARTQRGKKPTAKMKKFAKVYVATGNKAEAVRQAYNIKPNTSPSLPTTIANENLKKPVVQELIEEYSEQAMRNIVDLGNKAESESVKFQANKDIVDRQLGKAIARTETRSVSLTLTSDDIQEVDNVKDILRSS